ncbi:MAG: hypothetical protein JWR09_3033 [Mucilaginibacter sp.]|nr:hypothetical protein [Mucilaginibacter sp.]
MEDFDHILLFKTNCKTFADKLVLQCLLEQQEGIDEWNIDLEDCDYVLRIISYTLSHNCIIKLLNHHGYHCCELI